MPFTEELPPENTNPWYLPLISAWGALTTFVNGLETTLANKVNSSTYSAGLAGKIDVTSRGVANGVATLDGAGKVPSTQIPDIALSKFLGPVASQAAMLALNGQEGDWTVRTDLSGATFMLSSGSPATLASWIAIGTAGGGTWGSITGTLAAQTDLATALAGKMPTIADPGADRLWGWDDSANAWIGFTLGAGLAFSGTTIVSTATAGAATSLDIDMTSGFYNFPATIGTGVLHVYTHGPTEPTSANIKINGTTSATLPSYIGTGPGTARHDWIYDTRVS